MPRSHASSYRIISKHGHTILMDTTASTLTNALRIANGARDAYADHVTLSADDTVSLTWQRHLDNWYRIA